jgi:hypothetical protein
MPDRRPQSVTEIEARTLGPPGVKGELRVLSMAVAEKRTDQERLHDQSERLFRVTAQLAKAPPTAEDIRLSFTEEDGSSFLSLPDHVTLGRVRCAGGTFEFKKNSRGEKSLVAFECTAKNPGEARRQFQSNVLPFIDYLSYWANCPIIVAAISVEDPKNLCTTMEYVSPYRSVTGYPHISNLQMEMLPVYAMYREAKNSHSDFYRFLCYYKILEGLLGKLRAELYNRAKHAGVKLTPLKEFVPNSSEIAHVHRSYIGTSVKRFFDEVMTPQFRNAVAHFATDDGGILNMSEPEHIQRYADIVFVSELCVREVIASHEKLLTELQRARSTGAS